jgi:hypothetical protein
MQGIPKRCIHKVNIPYYNVYASFWDTLCDRHYLFQLCTATMHQIIVLTKEGKL